MNIYKKIMKWTRAHNRQIVPARRLKKFTRNVLVNVLMYMCLNFQWLPTVG